MPTRRPSAVRAERQGGRLEGAAAEALHDAERDECAGRPRDGRQQRADDEEREADEEHPAAAEALDRPARHRQRHRGGEQVADADPADRGHRRVERRREAVDGDGDDRAVEDGHEGRRRHHADHGHGAPVERRVHGDRLGNICSVHGTPT
ncbi:MAG TPA: hypothetical protein VFT09_13335 [Ilumatobacteraceae bacterium]|nr:hypothetical protein [Ilumatobacteraceae bacterium]